MEIGRTLRAMREAKGWSQKMLAKKAGLSERHVWRLEHGWNVTLKTLQKVATGLGARIVFRFEPIKR